MRNARRESLVHAPTRRTVLRWGALTGAAVLGAPAARAASCRSLSLYAINTSERLRVDYCIDGRYQPDALRAIARLMRDHRADAVHAIDPALLDALSALARTLGTTQPLHVVSGYRTRETNEQKRRHQRGVAAASYHLSGRAVDLFVPGRSLAGVRHVALAMRAGGVGYYPRSGFVHVDTGPLRSW
jgi:uncharacterized protein YcbK (DUF882 family)